MALSGDLSEITPTYNQQVAVDDWALAPEIVHLNHGSYGGCPRAVLASAAGWRARLEAAPMRFMVLDWQTELDRARTALAAFLHAPEHQLVFLPNATTAVATALAAARIDAGDELLTTDLAYRACRNQLDRLAEARGARVVVAELPWPFDPDAAVHAIAKAVTPRTRLALLDHITSPTACVLPLERILPHLRGVQVVVDGAHAPGQIDLDITALLAAGVTWYAGNNHKWLCAPKGTGFLVTTTAVRPLVTSHGASAEYGPANRLHAELDWMGTYDPAPHYTVPTAIQTVADLGGGWPAVRAHNHALVLELLARLGGSAIAPDHAIGSMAAFPIELPAGMTRTSLETTLLEDGWEVPIVQTRHGILVRVSAHLYNQASEGDALAAKLHALGVTPRTL
jgi:isopenicillin-N epimerase